MEQWRGELARQPLAMSETQACGALGITAAQGGVVSEDDMRRAYRALARRCGLRDGGLRVCCLSAALMDAWGKWAQHVLCNVPGCLAVVGYDICAGMQNKVCNRVGSA